MTPALPADEDTSEMWPWTDNQLSLLEQCYTQLALDAMPAQVMMSVDTLLITALFGNLSKFKTCGVLVPANTLDASVDVMLAVRVKTLWLGIFQNKDALVQNVHNAACEFAERLQHMEGMDFQGSARAINRTIQQYVRFGRSTFSTDSFVGSFAIRYHYVHVNSSNISLACMRITGVDKWCYRMKAAKPIGAGTVLLRALANLAQDAPFNFDNNSVKATLSEHLELLVVKQSKWMRGTRFSSIMLGPLQFINHLCNPNMHVSSNAFCRMTHVLMECRCTQLTTPIAVLLLPCAPLQRTNQSQSSMPTHESSTGLTAVSADARSVPHSHLSNTLKRTHRIVARLHTRNTLKKRGVFGRRQPGVAERGKASQKSQQTLSDVHL
jgi:hypothetical protein